MLIHSRLLVGAALVLFVALLWQHRAPAYWRDPLPARAGPPQIVRVEDGSTRKVCQVLGEYDRHERRATVNRTETRAGFWGADLGASFEHEGRLYLLFGDTHPIPGVHRPRDADSIALSSTAVPEDCLQLDFLRDPDGSFRPLLIPGVDTSAFHVPTGGLSLHSGIYIFVSSDHPPGRSMGRGVMARSDDGGRTFRHVHDISTAHFISVSPSPAGRGEVAHLPVQAEHAVLLWGSGAYRRSNPHLAIVAADRIEDPSAKRFFAGVDGGTGSPLWSSREADSQPLFDQPCLGEFSVAWEPRLRRWLMLYNCGWPRAQILLRSAERPWGAWSEPKVLFDPVRDAGECAFLNPHPQTELRHVAADGCPMVTDAHTPLVLGDPYGPYLIPRFFRDHHHGGAVVHFVMSTWNPYTVVLMRAVLRLD